MAKILKRFAAVYGNFGIEIKNSIEKICFKNAKNQYQFFG